MTGARTPSDPIATLHQTQQNSPSHEKTTQGQNEPARDQNGRNPQDGVLGIDVDDDNDLSFRAVQGVDVQVSGLNVSIDTSPSRLAKAWSFGIERRITENGSSKSILGNVTAFMPSGSLTAILGASGSGKTSLLNALSHRIKQGRLKTEGSILYNGNSRLSSVRSAYVMQQDVLLPTLTVRETLYYAAELRLPPPTTREERERIVEEVLQELSLKECATTRIGNNVHKGCSGGEKRRCSLAVQMLANPSVLFCDESTSGLDSATASQLVRTLKYLARKGRNVIITIHQPRSEIWSLFDNVLLLAMGSTVYSGPARECLPHFTTLGYQMASFINPAEFLIDLAAVDLRTAEAEAASSARVRALVDAWKGRSQNVDPHKGCPFLDKTYQHGDRSRQEDAMPNMQHHASLGRQIFVLTRRTFKVTWRDPMGIAGTMFEAISMGILTGWIFFRLDGSQEGIRSREGAVYTAAGLQGYLILLFDTYRLTVDIQLFDREFGEGVITVPAFLISRRLARIFLEDMSVPLIFSAIFYFMCGFRPLASQFFQFYSVTLLMQYIAVNLATVCVAVSRDFAVASFVANMAFTLQSLGCGYFVQPNQIPTWTRWLKWTAYTFYAYSALAANEFVGHTKSSAGWLYDCPEPGGAGNPACIEYTGAYIMQTLGLPSDWVRRPIWVLFGFAVAFFLGSGVLLHFKRVGMGVSKARKEDTDLAAGKEKFAEASVTNRKVNLKLENYSLDVHKRKFLSQQTLKLPILRSLNAEIPSGVLNVIMGPSGSGKTSLLNSMARRLHNSLTTTYRQRGEMTVNGAVPSEKVIRSIFSYVAQDDDALLPYLTVRENLRFAAGLRLPAHMSKVEKRARADSMLLKMGLLGCAETLVGSELVKGISGGEKRRVTIGIQILNHSQVLLCDEPTSGLDAFTATSIIQVLLGLAKEGRTLVMTIHHPRSDIFRYFDNILLLARGGSPVYSGPSSGMMSHFASLGFTCPEETNPADFALDLITVNLQNAKRESATREKVHSLILEWNENPQVSLIGTNTHIATPAELGSLARSMTPFRIAFPILLYRSLINFRRNSTAIVARTTQVIGFGVTLVLFFAPLKSDFYSVQTRLGFIQEIAPLYFVGMLQCVAVYPSERDVFYHEHDDNAYSVEAFFWQYTLAELPFEIFTSLFFAVLAVMAVGLPRTAQLFFIVSFNAFGIVSCGESLGIIFTTLFSHTGFAVNVTSVFLSLAMLMGGVMSLNIPAFLQAFNHLSPIKWSLGNLAPYTLRGVVFTCTADQKLPNGTCPISTGEEALKLYNLDTNAGLNVLALGICAIVYRMLAFLVLKAKMASWSLKSVSSFRRLRGAGGAKKSIAATPPVDKRDEKSET